MVGITILHFSPQALDISLIQLTDLDFIEFYFSLIVFDNILDLVFQLIVVLLNQLKSVLFIPLQVLVDFKYSSNLLLLSSDNSFQDLQIVIVVCSQIGLSVLIGLPLLGKLIIIETSQVFNSLSITIVIVLQLISQISIIVRQPNNLSLTFLASSLQSIIALLNLMPLLFNFIVQSLDLSLMQVLQLIFIFAMLSHQVILYIIIFRFDQIDFMRFLLFEFLQLIFTIIGLYNPLFTYDFNY